MTARRKAGMGTVLVVISGAMIGYAIASGTSHSEAGEHSKSSQAHSEVAKMAGEPQGLGADGLLHAVAPVPSTSVEMDAVALRAKSSKQVPSFGVPPCECGAECDWCWCDTAFENDCPEDWNGTGDGCDCGCQFCDPDCPSCSGGPCECGAECDWCWCDTAFENDCPEDWNGTGDGCDCGCQFCDLDCPSCGGGPPNDDCADAIPVSDGVTSFDTTGATTDGPDEPTMCDFFGDTQIHSDIWYCYTSSHTGIATFSLCGSFYDTKMAIYDGCGCLPFSPPIACNDDFCGLQSEISMPVTQGSQYLIRIGGYAGDTGSGILSITSTCVDISGGQDYEICVETFDAETGVPVPAYVHVHVCEGCQPGLCGGCGGKVNPPGGWSEYDSKTGRYIFCTTYTADPCEGHVCVRLWVDNPDPYPDPELWWCFDQTVTCAGDTCASAFVIGGLPFSDAGSTCTCIDDYDEVCPYKGSTSPDLAYVYTPAADVTVDISLCTNSAYDTKAYVYQGACPGTLVGCNDDSCATPNFPSPYVSELDCVAMTAGNTYYIVVDGYADDCGNYTIDVTECGSCCGNGVCDCNETCDTCPQDCQEPEVCNDDIDNDCDGLTDCDDPDCQDGPSSCWSNAGCNLCSYCHFPFGTCMGPGTCEPIPDFCPQVIDPVCGCDGATYMNEGCAALEGVSVAYAGECCGDGKCDLWGLGLEDSCTCPQDCGSPPESETDCGDRIDNDCDGLTDASDPDCPCLCGDLDGDNEVTLSDFVTFARCFGLCAPTPQCSADELLCSDLNGDGCIDLNDFVTFARCFGRPPLGTPPNCCP